MPERCQGRMTFTGYCERKPSVIRDGKHYCWQHDPERLRVRAIAQWEERKLEIARVEAEQDARINRRKLLEAAGADKLSDEELRSIIALGGIQAMIQKGLDQ